MRIRTVDAEVHPSAPDHTLGTRDWMSDLSVLEYLDSQYLCMQDSDAD